MSAQPNPSDSSYSVLKYIFASAITQRASDIHIDSEGNKLVVRFRIDGNLNLFNTFDVQLRDVIISQLKISAKMNITEHRFPQDGHIEFPYSNTLYNIRASSLPTLYGEALVLRILNRVESFLTLDKLGMEETQLMYVKKIIESPNGMLLITGPTGSGKTNFLYSVINYLNRPEKNIITLEDPIEYFMKNVRQTQINESINYTFAKAMRAVVRQDPNVIMLGEIRDSDTVQMALQAALVGILVLSTFHTFDIPALISRLTEMGATNSVIAQAVRGVVSSRLVRQICQSCKGSYKIDASLAKSLGATTDVLVKGTGCSNCANTGYFGRTGIYEVIYFDDEIKSAIVERRTAMETLQLIRKKQFTSLREMAIKKVLTGITTMEEAQRVVGGLV